MDSMRRCGSWPAHWGDASDEAGQALAAPKVGTVQQGFRFKGGDPENPSSRWAGLLVYAGGRGALGMADRSKTDDRLGL